MSQPTSALEHYPDYETVIGIEVHVQLNTNSKIFCSCANEITKEPNTHICNICAGHPGVLPVLNKNVVDSAILMGLATNCSIAPVSQFARKHYFYPDLPKNYQITQSDQPICTEGYIPIRLEDGSIKKIRLIRIHMEEDAGKNIHADAGETFVDLNRTGTPLLEIVTYPDISNAYEAKAYLQELHMLVHYLQIGTGNMQEGAFRADTNISVRKKGATKLGTKCELKNINSFKFIGDAIEYEIDRQIALVEDGGTVAQETRLWDTKAKKTVTMRSKEEAADYRYFNEPDLPLVEISQEWITRMQKQLPELPLEKYNRFINNFGLSSYEAEILVGDVKLANYFEQAMEQYASKQTVNWILRDLMGYLKENKIDLIECLVTPKKLAQIVKMLDEGKINNHAAKQVFEQVAQTGNKPTDIVKQQGLEQIGSEKELEKIVQQIIEDNPKNVALYKSGKDKLFGFFVGQAMKKTQGKGDPKVIQKLLKAKLTH